MSSLGPLPIAFKDTVSVAVAPTIISDLHRRVSTELFKVFGVPLSKVLFTVVKAVFSWDE